jgi:hypothetical protein
MSLNPPTLLELAGRAVKVAGLNLEAGDLPKTLLDYLSCANCCVNPKCKGKPISFNFSFSENQRAIKKKIKIYFTYTN